MNGSFRKRGDNWSYIVDLGPDPSTGKRRQKEKGGFRTKKEAQAAAAELIVQIENSEYKKPVKQSLEKYLIDWLESKRIGLKKNTFSIYKHHIEHHIIPAIGKIELAKLTPAEISTLYAMLISEKHLSEGTVRDTHKVLTAALGQALKWGMIIKNPASLVEKPKVNRKELSVWDAEQAKTFLAFAKKHQNYIAFLLALGTGMRQGEILGLRWKDVDLDAGIIRIVQTLSHDGKELSAGAKTKSGNRTISVDVELVKELRKQKSRILMNRLKSEGMYTDHDLVIPTSKGTPITPRNLSRSYYLLLERSEVPQITFHDLRHTHATLLLTQGVHPKVVAERLGHADMRTTLEIYSHVLPHMQKEAADKVGRLLFS
ncbi:site-specific integrase [Paenibacillus ginsengarvi]|uniref:Site-specific integrase n=1 Tax=Paenibacillus ginsengarvi TaxID=400777 RepID=A0A3B0CT48_9BACL|nr:site-specific integrase [Paenibacillus ginsengarvi]RKN86788.1 site-specific integrase [Paenibacillus ginsengarvi]